MFRLTVLPFPPHYRRRLRTGAVHLLLAGCLSLPLLSSAWADEAPAAAPISVVETRLFLSDHFRTLPARNTVLTYRFAKTGTYEPGYEDKVSLEIAPANPQTTGGRPTKLEFLSGEHKVELPVIEAATGNPVIMGFLERDVREMKRITGGQPAYYRKRLRLAMVEAQTLKATTVKWGGQDIKADEITIDPYKDDPARSRFARFANKLYTFVLSDQVPGGVFSLRSVMRDGSNSGKTMIDETQTLTENK